MENENITYAEALKDIRKTARDNGMTFKRQKGSKILFCFVIRGTDKVIEDMYTLWNAYENCMSGYIATINKKGDRT